MTLIEFNELVTFIITNHAWGGSVPFQGWKIKYIRPHFDTRSQTIFAIEFDGMFDHKVFSVTNENRHRNLKEWIHEWLDSYPPTRRDTK